MAKKIAISSSCLIYSPLHYMTVALAAPYYWYQLVFSVIPWIRLSHFVRFAFSASD
jgi:hypothetical protein